MSVPTYRRNESKTEYLNMLYELNVNLGKIIMNKPKKYRENYGDHIIKTALESLKYAQTANSIFTDKNTSQTDIELRRNLLIKAKGGGKIMALTNNCGGGGTFIKNRSDNSACKELYFVKM